jgi:TRAP-type C4-dicarboxylate transport system permease small subunit
LTGKLLFFVFGALLLYDSSQHLYRMIWVRPQISPALMISMAFAYGAVPIGFALMLARLVQECLRFFRDREYLDPDVLKRIAAEEGGSAS